MRRKYKITMIFLILSVFLFTEAKLIPPTSDTNQLVADVPIEQKSWFENQLIRPSYRHPYDDNLGDIAVFDGGTWNPYPACRSCGKFQNYRATCHNNAEYLNLCGECVGGNSEKDDDYGLDSCGICAGIERCGRTSCEDSIDEDIETPKNCTRVIGIRPKVIDMASSPKGVIHLIGNIDQNKLLCGVYSGATESGKVEVSETDLGLVFEFELPQKEGRLDMHCNSSGGFVLMNSVLVVDSRKLQPLSVDEKSIEYGKESKIVMVVGSMYALADLLCFAKDEEGVVSYKAWSNDIQGNPLSSKVVCDRIWPKKAGKLKFGIAYSEEALSQVKTLEIDVIAKDLTLLWASLLKDKLTLHFDQVLERYTNCHDVFETISDKSAKCWSVGNEIRARFKGAPNVKVGETLAVKVASASTGVQESFSVKIDGSHVSESLMKLEIRGPDVVCSGQKVSFDIDGVNVKWSLAVPNTTYSDGAMTPGNRQRKNMMLWRGLRESKKLLRSEGADNRISLNTTLLSPGVEYQVKATLPDGQDRAMTFTKNFKIASDNASKPIIKGPSRLTWTHDALYEIENPSCDTNIRNLKYEWAVDDDKQSLIQQTGSKMHLKGGVLSSHTKYNLTVRLLNNENLVSEAAMEVVTQPTHLKAATYVEEIVYGTGHRIILLGNSDIIPTNAAEAKYRWSCESETGPCLMPGKERKSIETAGGFDTSVLVLSAGSLPVGKYAFTLNVSLLSGETTSKSTRVLVVSGEPTLISLISVDFEPNLKVVTQAKDIIGECEIYLECLKSINTSYLDLSELTEPYKITGAPNNPQSKTLLLNVPYEKLVHGTSYMFRLTADCGALSQSWMTFTVPVPDKSTSCELVVTPNSGAALSTEFSFQVTDCYPTNPIYSFGFLRDGTVYYLISTQEPHQKIMSFPGTVKPVMRLCEAGKMCAVYTGTDIIVESSTADVEAVRSVLDEFSDNLKSGHFEEVLGTCTLLLESCKEDLEVRRNISESLLRILMDRIEEISNVIDKNVDVGSDALNLLQSALGVVKAADASDEAIAVILKFRDKIEEKVKRSDEVELPKEEVEHRQKRSITITKRKTGEMDSIHKVKTFLETYSVTLEQMNSTENATKEINKMLQSISRYVETMCNDIMKGHPSIDVESKITNIYATRLIEPRKEKSLNMSIPDHPEKLPNSTIRVVLDSMFLEESNITNDVCLGFTFFPEDYISKSRNATSERNITRMSMVYRSVLYQYVGKELENITANEKKAPLGKIRIPIIHNKTEPVGTKLKCHLWKSGFGWNYNPCTTLTKEGDFINCKCPFPGTYAVFAVKSEPERATVTTQKPQSKPLPTIVTVNPTTPKLPATTVTAPIITVTIPTTTVTVATTKVTVAPVTSPTAVISKTTVTNGTTVAPHDVTATITTTQTPVTKATLPDSTTPLAPTLKPEDYKMAASFVIDEKYNDTVGARKQEFEDSIRSQLTKKVQIHEQTQLEAVDNHENIKVVVRLRYGEKSEISMLHDLLNNGNLTLFGLNQKELKVPKQNLELSFHKPGGPSSFAVVASAIFISLTFILAVLLSGMFLKWKRQQRALSFVQNMEISAPKYLRLQETSSFERIERSYGSTENLRTGDLDSGIVLTVDPNRMSTKYHAGDSSSSSRNTVA